MSKEHNNDSDQYLAASICEENEKMKNERLSGIKRRKYSRRE